MNSLINKAVFGIIVLSIFSNCKKVDEFTKFEMEFTETFVVSAGTELNIPISIATPAIDTKYEEIYSSYKTNTEKIEEIVLKSLEFTILNPEDGSFDFLESVSVSMSTEGKDDESIASASNIPNDGSGNLILETSDKNLKDYISVNQFSLKSNVSTDQLVLEDQTLEVHAVFFVDAKVLGQ